MYMYLGFVPLKYNLCSTDLKIRFIIVMSYTEIIAAPQEIPRKHRTQTGRRVYGCYNWWYLQRPLKSKYLISCDNFMYFWIRVLCLNFQSPLYPVEVYQIHNLLHVFNCRSRPIMSYVFISYQISVTVTLHCSPSIMFSAIH